MTDEIQSVDPSDQGQEGADVHRGDESAEDRRGLSRSGTALISREAVDHYPHIETSGALGKVLESDEDAAKAEKDESGDKSRREEIKKLEESYGMIEAGHPLRQDLQEMFDKVYKDTGMTIQIILDPEINAFTYVRGKEAFVNAGLIIEMQDFFQGQGKGLTYEHLLWVVGHEWTHHDPKAKYINLSEYHCDIESAKNMARAGFNPQAAVEALEFLRYVNDESFGVTHPGADARLTDMRKMLSDPNYYLPNKNVSTKPVEKELVASVDQEAKRWHHSLEIWQETDRERLNAMLESETDLTAAVEIVERMSDLVYADVAKEVLTDPRTANMMLFVATLESFRTSNYYGDRAFDTGFVHRLAADDAVLLGNMTPYKDNWETAGAEVPIYSQFIERAKAELQTYTDGGGRGYDLDEHRIALLNDILDGNFEDPLGILETRDEKFSKFQELGVDFNTVFGLMERNVSNLYSPDQSGEEGRPPKYPFNIDVPRLNYGQTDLREHINPGDQFLVLEGRRIVLENCFPQFIKAQIQNKFSLGDLSLSAAGADEVTALSEASAKAISRILTEKNPDLMPEAVDAVQSTFIHAIMGEGTDAVRDLYESLSPEIRAQYVELVRGLKAYTIFGGDEYEQSRGIKTKIGRFEININASMMQVELVAMRDMPLSEIFQQYEGFQGFIATTYWQSDEFENYLTQRMQQETDIEEIKKTARVLKYDNQFFTELISNENVSNETLHEIITEGIEAQKIDSYGIRSILIDIEKDGDISTREKLDFLEAYLPYHKVNQSYEARDIYPNILALISKEYPDLSIDEKIVRVFKIGGLALPREVNISPLDSFKNPILSEADLDELAQLPQEQLDNLSQTMQFVVSQQQDRFGASVKSEINNFIAEVALAKHITRRGSEWSINEIDSSVSFDERLEWVRRNIPPGEAGDKYLEKLLDSYEFAYGSEAVEKVLPLLDTLRAEPSDQVSLYGKRRPLEEDGDPYDFFGTVLAEKGLKVAVIDRLIDKEKSFWDSDTVSLTEKLNRLDDLVPEKCEYRDLIFAQLAQREFKRVDAMDVNTDSGKLERLILAETLRVRLEHIESSGIRTTVGAKGIELVNQADPTRFEEFATGLEIITNYLPDYSYKRDGFIVNLVNSSSTTRDDMLSAMDLLLSNNYRSDRKDVAIARGVGEAMGVLMREGLSRDEKGQLLLWLLDPSATPKSLQEARDRNLVDEYDLSKDRFYTTRLSDLGREEFVRQYGEEIISYGYVSTDEVVSDLDELREINDRAYVRVMNGGLPQDVETALNSSNKHILSLRRNFMMMNEFERREFLFDLMTSSDGIFAEARDEEGDTKLRTFLGEFSGLLTKDIDDMPSERKTMVKDILTEVFVSLPPESRSNTLLRLLDIFAENEGKISSGPEMVKKSLEALGVVGVKLGQILSEQKDLLPDAYREELRTLKDEVRPSSKTFAFQIMESEGVLDQYGTLGKLLGSASIKQVYEVGSQDESDLVGKFRRPQTTETVAQNFVALRNVLNMVQEKYDVALPKDLISRLQDMVTAEIEFSGEVANVDLVSSMDRSIKHVKRNGFSVKVPEIVHAGEDAVFEYRAKGLSLAEIQRIQDGSSERMSSMPPEELEYYKGLNLGELSEAVGAEFLWQAFQHRSGKQQSYFHADLHAGNVYFSPEHEMTVIDWGMAGIMSTGKMQKDFFRIFIGMGTEDYGTVAKIIQGYTSDAPPDLQEILRTETQGKGSTESLQKILEFVGSYNPDMHLLTFIKSLISAQPYFDALSESTRDGIIAPYYVRHMPKRAVGKKVWERIKK